MPNPKDLLNAEITVHHGGPTWAEVVVGDRRAAFMIDELGALCETVEFTTADSWRGPPGSPDWTKSAICGSDGDLQRLILKRLKS
jgi:hypothetical protein